MEGAAAAYNMARRREGVEQKLHPHPDPPSCHNPIGQTQPKASQQRHGGLASRAQSRAGLGSSGWRGRWKTASAPLMYQAYVSYLILITTLDLKMQVLSFVTAAFL